MSIVLLTAIEIASILKISKGLSYRMIKDGDIPSVRFGRSVRVKQEDLDLFIQKKTLSKDDSKPVSNPDNSAMEKSL